MPESSLTEEAAIPPAGNVSGARVPSGHAIEVNVTGIPGRTARQGPAWSMTIDANTRVGDGSTFNVRPDVHPSGELLVEGEKPALIRHGQRIFDLPRGIREPIVSCSRGRGDSPPSGTRISSSLAGPRAHASKLLSPEG
jgi:hypothetical protein